MGPHAAALPRARQSGGVLYATPPRDGYCPVLPSPTPPPLPRRFDGAVGAAGTPHRHTATLSHCERGWLILTVRLLHLPWVVAASQQNMRPDNPSLCGIKFAL